MADVDGHTGNVDVQAIAAHLKRGPFATIFDQSNEKTDSIALKVMCIIDYNVQGLDLYRRMEAAGPKLLTQLLKFHSFGQLKYYDYIVGSEIGKRVLQCKFCEFTGQYGLVLTHMAINHNTHIGLKTCVYCNTMDLKTHFGSETLTECYNSYLQRNGIQWNEEVCNIAAEFYDMLKRISYKLGVHTARTHGYHGKGFKSVERLEAGYDSDIDENVTVFKYRSFKSKIRNNPARLNDLDKMFQRAMNHLYGGNGLARYVQKQPDTSTIIELSSDDEDGAASTSANQSRQSVSICI